MPSTPTLRSLALATLSLAVASCASDGARCGRGRYSDVHAQGHTTRNAVTGAVPGAAPSSGGPYCLEIAAEGVGSINVSVNSGAGGGGDGDLGDPLAGGGGVVGPTGGPGTPTTYTASQASIGFVDVCAQPNARHVLPNVDDGVAQIPEPDAPPIAFPVRVFDVATVPPFTVASNGWLSFVSNMPVGSLTGTVPSPSAPHLGAALYWTDLVTRAGVCYATVGSAPWRQFVVQWDDAMEFGGNGNAHLTFELIVREIRPPLTHNVIDIVYRNLDGVGRPDRPGAGLENSDGTVGVAVPNGPSAPRGIRFTPSH